MKKILFLMMGLAAGSASFAANTTEPSKPVVTASVISNEKISLVIAPQPVMATLALNDEQGHILYTSNVDLRAGVRQQFDISKLQHGVYKLSIAVGKEQTVQSFTVTEVPSHQLVTIQP